MVNKQVEVELTEDDILWAIEEKVIPFYNSISLFSCVLDTYELNLISELRRASWFGCETLSEMKDKLTRLIHSIDECLGEE